MASHKFLLQGYFSCTLGFVRGKQKFHRTLCHSVGAKTPYIVFFLALTKFPEEEFQGEDSFVSQFIGVDLHGREVWFFWFGLHNGNWILAWFAYAWEMCEAERARPKL